MTSDVGKLHVVRPDHRDTLKLIVLPGKPLGAGVIDEGNGIGLEWYLHDNGCTKAVDRCVCPVGWSNVGRVRDVLSEHATMRIAGEPAWLEIPGSIAGEDVIVFLLTREQVTRTKDRIAFIDNGLLHLSNGQMVDAQYFHRPYRTIPLTWAEGYSGVSPDGIKYMQMIDSSPFSDILDNPHSYYVIMNSRAAVTHSTGWVKVSNPVGVDHVSELTTSFAVRTAFSDHVGEREVAVDETVSLAIGMREGEVVHVESIDPKVGTLRRRAFSFRHAVVRVVSATTTDMEKPLVRLPVGVLDILGLTSGSRVIVESLSREDNQIRRVSVRALEEREPPRRRLGGVLDVLEITGKDLPVIAMDLSLRNKLGIRRGDPVYVRPEFATVVFEEFTTVSFALLAAAVGSFLANAQLLAVVLTGTYVILSAVGVWRKFR